MTVLINGLGANRFRLIACTAVLNCTTIGGINAMNFVKCWTENLLKRGVVAGAIAVAWIRTSVFLLTVVSKLAIAAAKILGKERPRIAVKVTVLARFLMIALLVAMLNPIAADKIAPICLVEDDENTLFEAVNVLLVCFNCTADKVAIEATKFMILCLILVTMPLKTGSLAITSLPTSFEIAGINDTEPD